jgi:hypothetical protein
MPGLKILREEASGLIAGPGFGLWTTILPVGAIEADAADDFRS